MVLKVFNCHFDVVGELNRSIYQYVYDREDIRRMMTLVCVHFLLTL